MSLWLKISFLREKKNCKSLTFIYEMTLGELWLFEGFLEKVIVRNKNNGLQFHFYFILNYFTFSIFRTLRLGLEWWLVTTMIMRHKRKK